MKEQLVLVMLLYVVAAVALPEYPCSENITKHGEILKTDPCSNTSAFTKLYSCLDFLNNNTTLPSAECCGDVHDVWLQFPACFCRVTFFEHGFGQILRPGFVHARCCVTSPPTFAISARHICFPINMKLAHARSEVQRWSPLS